MICKYYILAQSIGLQTRLKEDLERSGQRLSETESECQALRQTAGRLDREQVLLTMSIYS